MNIVLDAIALSRCGPADDRIRHEIVSLLVRFGSTAETEGTTAIILDRACDLAGRCTGAIPFPGYRPTGPVADAMVLQRVCDWAKADVFMSTGLTAPISTPTLQLLWEPSLAILTDEPSLPETWMREAELTLGFSSLVSFRSLALAEALQARFPDVLASAQDGVGTEIAILDRGHVPEAEAVAELFAQTRRVAEQPVDEDMMRRWTALRRMQAAFEI